MLKNKYRKIGVFLLFLLCFFASRLLGQEVVIYHTNDTHSQIDEISHGSLTSYSGYAKRLSLLKEMRSKDSISFLFDAGDIIQGTPYFNLFGGKVEVQLMNMMAYDAMTLGNHEFDNGVDSLAKVLAKADFPILCANYDFSGTALNGMVKPFIIIERKGIKVGVIGISPDLQGLVSPEKYQGLEYRTPINIVNAYADTLKNRENCDFVILLSHLGFDADNRDGVNDTVLSQNSYHVDAIIGGHTHTLIEQVKVYTNRLNKPIYLVQAGSRGAYVGRLVLRKD